MAEKILTAFNWCRIVKASDGRLAVVAYDTDINDDTNVHVKIEGYASFGLVSTKAALPSEEHALKVIEDDKYNLADKIYKLIDEIEAEKDNPDELGVPE